MNVNDCRRWLVGERRVRKGRGGRVEQGRGSYSQREGRYGQGGRGGDMKVGGR